MISIKIHTGPDGDVLAACDTDVLGKTFVHNGHRITISESFYRDRNVTEEELGKLMEQASVMNLMGERTVAVAIRKGYITEESVLDIGVKHVQVVR